MIISKRMRQANGLVDRMKTYPLAEAVDVLSRFPKAKFDETVELSIHLGVDTKQTNQMVRGTVNLPHGSGKKVRVIVFTENPAAAKAAGADEAGLEDLLARVEGGWIDFDVAVATPGAMKEVRRVAKILGPRGLMPNPKSGTVVDDPAVALRAIKSGGRVEYKMDKTGNLGVIVGKRSFGPKELAENISIVLETIGRQRPEGLKGTRFIRSATISGTMTPGVRLDQTLFSHY